MSKKYVSDFAHFDKSDLASGENVLNASFMYGHVRNHHLIQKSFAHETWETNMRNQDLDKYVSRHLIQHVNRVSNS